jgi:hypothetical protein
MFDCPSDTNEKVTAEQFFVEYGETAFQASCYYYVYSNEKQMRWEFENYRKIATAHQLTMSRDKIHEGVAKFAAALACIACLQ